MSEEHSNDKQPSEAQIKANRENAKKSTGPKSAEGKKRVARNALKHGLTAELEINTKFEFDGEFNLFQQQMHAQFAPASPEEIALVDRITTLHWRLKRIPLMESKYIDKISEDDPALALQNEAKTLSNLSRYEGQLDRCLHRTLKELKETQAARHAFPYQTRTFLFIEESPLSVDDRATGRGLGVGNSATPSPCAETRGPLASETQFFSVKAEGEGAGDGGSQNCETNPIPETPSSCALLPDLSDVSFRAEEEGAGDGGSAADKTNPIAAQSTSPGTCCGGGSVSEANSGGGVPNTGRRSLVADSHLDETKPILSQDSHLAQARPAPCDPAANDPSDASDPNTDRRSPVADSNTSRQSLIASRDPEAAYYEAINCAMAMLNISPYDELNIEELEKLIPEHLRRHTPSSCALHPDLSDVSFRAEEEGEGDGGSAVDKTSPFSHDSRLTAHGSRSADETKPILSQDSHLAQAHPALNDPAPRDKSGSSDLSDGFSPNAERLTPNAFPSDRRSPVADSAPSDPNAERLTPNAFPPQSSIVNSQSSKEGPPNPYVS